MASIYENALCVWTVGAMEHDFAILAPGVQSGFPFIHSCPAQGTGNQIPIVGRIFMVELVMLNGHIFSSIRSNCVRAGVCLNDSKCRSNVHICMESSIDQSDQRKRPTEDTSAAALS